jgi:uncharacterized protein
MISPALQLVLVMGAGTIAGGMGALLGLGGGVFLVPFLNLGLGLPFQDAVATSLVTVIATSSAVSARSAGKQLINLRLGMLLEVATAIGGLAGALTMQMMSERTLQLLFATRDRGDLRRDAPTPGAPQRHPGCRPPTRAVSAGSTHEQESGGLVTYRVKRLPLALGASLVAGNISSFLGIGGGILKVPVLNAWCGVPLRRRGSHERAHDRRHRGGGRARCTTRAAYINEVIAAASVLGVLGGLPRRLLARRARRARSG